MSACRPVAGLAEIAGDHDLLLCDVFGTLHDAERTFPAALDALARFRGGGGTVVLVSNAAEPGPRLSATLAARGIAGVFDGLVSAADVARAIIRERDPDAILHIGPDRDRGLFDELPPMLDAPDADLVVCTGYPEDDAGLDAVLDRARRRGALMLCTNPDTSLRVGDRELRFAGLVAGRYRALGGAVVETGKPGPRIYAAAVSAAGLATGRAFDPARILGLGDTPALDAGGALAAGFSAALLAPARADPPAGPGAGRRYRLPALAW
ncbi:HAD family hydrolase [Methylorubrum thiocyanatum]|uniref:HAD family hydrolase n=1 Tax=Methylorubrum thiocyanatum TaxID=47958 RepID=UPI00398C6D6B